MEKSKAKKTLTIAKNLRAFKRNENNIMMNIGGDLIHIKRDDKPKAFHELKKKLIEAEMWEIKD
ncbi:hypothetical protein AB3N04_06185 [Alkalihalophilus sp. As8PL]|uniref:Uncharacterized protein n=1 Tax=Alkalihalophilus sp. As8PL TaxID=3237103 RepID=A0AB39BV56_9BACI